MYILKYEKHYIVDLLLTYEKHYIIGKYNSYIIELFRSLKYYIFIFNGTEHINTRMTLLLLQKNDKLSRHIMLVHKHNKEMCIVILKL